jgi:hypothetical protein
MDTVLNFVTIQQKGTVLDFRVQILSEKADSNTDGQHILHCNGNVVIDGVPAQYHILLSNNMFLTFILITIFSIYS